MKLTSIAVDPAAMTTAQWVDDIPEMEDLRLKMRAAGNPDWRRLQARLINAVPRGRRSAGGLDPADVDRINVALIVETSLEDWDRFEDDSGAPIPFAKETALRFLSDPAYRKLYEACLWAASLVAEETAAAREMQKGNSARALPGT